MRPLLITLSLLFAAIAPARSQVSVGIDLSMPGIDIGINLPAYPKLVPVPGYPVYYDPRGSTNYFFYDGLYWVYRNDDWYASSWYNGPWRAVVRASVPLYVLRVPVRYYRQPPPHFRGASAGAPPRWGEHWGPEWASRHRDWDRWDRRSTPLPAPLPVYQRSYRGEHYPRKVEEQRKLQARNDHHQAQEPTPRGHEPRADAGPSHGQQRGDARPKPSAEGHERKGSKHQDSGEARHDHNGG